MAYINLLPWREKQRLKNNKQFLKQVYIAIGLGVVIILSLWVYLKIIQNNQLKLNQQLETDNLQLMSQLHQDKKTQNELKQILSQIDLLTFSLKNRKGILQIWNLIANTLPNTIQLTSFQKTQDSITFKGVADDATAVSLWVHRLEASHNLQHVQIVSIKQQSISGTINSSHTQTSGLSDIANQELQRRSNSNSNRTIAESNSSNEVKGDYSKINFNNTSGYEFLVTAEVIDVSELPIQSLTEMRKQNQYQPVNQMQFSNQYKNQPPLRPFEQSNFPNVITVSKVIPLSWQPLDSKPTLYFDNHSALSISSPLLYKISAINSFRIRLKETDSAKSIASSTFSGCSDA